MSTLSRVCFDPDTTAPSTPISVAAAALSSSAIRVSWGASTDTGGSGLAGYRVYRSSTQNGTYTQVGSDLSVASLSYDDEGLTATTTYWYRVRAFDGNANVSSQSVAVQATTQEPAVEPSLWPVQAANSRIHAIPGLNIYGSDSYGGSGRNTGGAVDIFLVNDLTDAVTSSAVSGLGSNVFEGTLRGGFALNNGRPKLLIQACSGSPNYTPRGILCDESNWSYWGQFAPAPGFFPRGFRLEVSGSNWQLWHYAAYLGEEYAAPLPANQAAGDAFRISSSTTSKVQYGLVINSEFSRSTDEIGDAFHGFDNLGFVYCAFLEAVGYLSSTGLHRTQYGPLFGGGSTNQPANHLSIERSLFAHNTSRNPWTSVQEVMLANNLWYNCGRLEDGEVLNGNGPTITNQRVFTTPLHYNLVRGLMIRGPDNISTLAGVEVHVTSSGQEFPSGSLIHIAGMAQRGWNAPASQANYIVRNDSSTFAYSSTARSSALPTGRLSTFADAYQISDQQEFVDLMRESVGVKPGMRSVGRVENTFNQIQARLDGSASTTRQLVKNSTEAGGWWSLSNVTVNPADPGVHWHAPLPTASSRHTPYTSGTFSNGTSRVGYTPMEVWAIEQHWFVGGQ